MTAAAPLQRVSYRSADGTTALSSFLALPAGGGPHPVILILRGVAGPDDGYTEIAERVAGWGYLVLVHGWKVRGDDPPDVEVSLDLDGAFAYLRALPEADIGRLAVFGFCRGGVHALMAATTHPEVRAVVVFHGFAFRPETAQPGAQPFDLVERVTVPTLVMHGTEDEQAPYPGMLRMERRLKTLGKSCEFVYSPGVRHGFAVRTHPGFEPRSARESFVEVRRFLDAHFTA